MTQNTLQHTKQKTKNKKHISLNKTNKIYKTKKSGMSGTGSVSGIVAKLVSYLDGNKNNKDSGLVSAGTYGAYFGKYMCHMDFI